MGCNENSNSNKSTSTRSQGALGAISTITNLLKNAFNPSTPLPGIPSAQILAGAPFREGLSSIDIASKIIQRKKDLGISIGPLPSGGDNLDLMMEVIRVEEITNAILTKMKVEVAIAPGTSLTATGGNAGGPIVVQGITTQIVKGLGIAR